MSIPVDDAVPVQEHKGQRDLGSVEPGTLLIKLPGTLDLEHEISAIDILHHKEQTVLGWGE